MLFLFISPQRSACNASSTKILFTSEAKAALAYEVAKEVLPANGGTNDELKLAQKADSLFGPRRDASHKQNKMHPS